ncbi:AMP-binding protein [Frankia sp. AvcI1]|uniref:AMP-binding protein n=1 Tax=Frankia sp. AvcI1 TaxID=573496 RepID=UPI002118825B|nr:AMP-binding protein [Frankia sp. AvcI1]
MTVHSTIDLLREHAARSSRGTALHADGRALSYGDLDGMSNRIGHALAVTAGARVAFLGKNSAHYFAVLAACGKVGAVIVPLNWRLAYPELTAIVADADAAVIVVDDEFAEVARRLEADPEVTLVVRTIDTRTGTGNWYDTFPATDPGYRPHRDDVAIQMYTSGTTGQPKGVMSTHGAVLDSLRILAGVAGIGRDAVSLCTLPTFHIGGTSWTLTGLWAGCTTVLLREVEPTAVLDTIAEHRVTNMIAVPAVIARLVDLLRKGDERTRSLSRLYYGGGPMTGPVLERTLATFDCELVQGFGMTELPLITALPPECHVAGSPLLRSCGRLVPETEARVVDPVTLVEVPVGEVGELWVRSARVMSGYWGKDRETALALVPGGWLRTGDVMHVDRDGFYFLHDRIKDVIISGGENVYSAEVENVLMAHPAIAECAVIGLPSAKWTETVAAVVVLRPGAVADERSIIEFCRTRIARYKCPTSVALTDDLPRTPAGKIQKHELRARYGTPGAPETGPGHRSVAGTSAGGTAGR